MTVPRKLFVSMPQVILDDRRKMERLLIAVVHASGGYVNIPREIDSLIQQNELFLEYFHNDTEILATHRKSEIIVEIDRDCPPDVIIFKQGNTEIARWPFKP